MRLVDDLVVRGAPPEIDKLVDRLQTDLQEGPWKHEPDLVKRLQDRGIGKQGVSGFSRRENAELPATFFYICRTSPDQLSSSSVISRGQKSLTDEEYNAVLADARSRIVTPLVGGIDVTIETVHPTLTRLEWLISPEALRRLIQFDGLTGDRNQLKREDRENWEAFSDQVHSDGSILEIQDLSSWLMKQGWTEDQIQQVVLPSDVGFMFETSGHRL